MVSSFGGSKLQGIGTSKRAPSSGVSTVLVC